MSKVQSLKSNVVQMRVTRSSYLYRFVSTLDIGLWTLDTLRSLDFLVVESAIP